MKPTTRPFTFRKVGGLFLAASIVAPSTALFAADYNKPASAQDKPEQHQQLQSDQKDVKEFKGKIVSAYDYLMQEQSMHSAAGIEGQDRDATGTRHHNPSRSDLTAANSAEAAAEQERNRADRSNNNNATSSDRSWMRDAATPAGLNQGPMGLLVQTDGVLGLGTGAKFYLLVPQETNAVNQTSYSRANRTTDPAQRGDQSDRTYVRDQARDNPSAEYPAAQKGAEKLTELSGKEAAFSAKDMNDKSGHQVTVKGTVVQRGGLEAIIVHGMSWQSESTDSDRSSERTGDRNDDNNRGL